MAYRRKYRLALLLFFLTFFPLLAVNFPDVVHAKKPMPVPHGLEGHEDCLICHDIGKFKPFPQDHKGRSKDQCFACHKKPETTAKAVKAEETEKSVTASATTSSCVSCHTSAGELIRITREIAASRPKVEKSAETAGEG
jgi:hypothetical protein